MIKKILIIAILPILIVVLLAGCSRTVSPPAPSMSPGSQSSTSSPVSPPRPSGSSTPTSPTLPSASGVPSPAPADPSSVIQSGLPLKVTQPIDGSNLNTGTITIVGETAPGATVYVNDQINTADNIGKFNVPVNLDDGPNFLDISAVDTSGKRGEILLMVNVVLPQVSTSPALPVSSLGAIPLKITSPADGATLNTTNVVVKGQTAPAATVSVNDQVDTADAQGNFSITVSLVTGLNVIDVNATDDSGNQVEIILMVNETG
jgi:hypothetical protein